MTEDQLKEIEARHQQDEWLARKCSVGSLAITAHNDRAALMKEVRRLGEALRPFALEADEWDGPAASAPDTLVPCIGTYQDREMADAMFTVGDLRRARAALGEAGRGSL